MSAAQFHMIYHIKESVMRRKDSPRAVGPRSSSNGFGIAARAKTKATGPISFPHPLCWWRVRRADAFTKADVCIARHLLRKTAVLGEPHWFLGAAGDPAVAMNVAHRAQRQGARVSLDVAMTAVLCIALTGDVAAALFLAAALKDRSDIDPPCAALSDSWLVYQPRRLSVRAVQVSRRE
ncbi:hypothetical protein OZ411_33700 [Bradyrhizobium sp. Arg237L]|uniref:hypothetical protein n=1 Tax=Bradyrhizobium sp. Arg237L TaxID=3003352 RepID=UPI00249F94E8|nr:hypothetical protein [Bradyrhizobium sp. Arg237L]MDI4237770.1 hypothetical protein [Bradyrhizobium sp. Arg237L]